MQFSDHCLNVVPCCDIGKICFSSDLVIGEAVLNRFKNIRFSFGEEITFLLMAWVEDVMNQWIDIIQCLLH